MELKIGDKIRLVGSTLDRGIQGSEGVITEVRPPNRGYHYRVYVYSKKTKRNFYYPVKDNEIERISEKGKQLEFAFMNEVV